MRRSVTVEQETKYQSCHADERNPYGTRTTRSEKAETEQTQQRAVCIGCNDVYGIQYTGTVHGTEQKNESHKKKGNARMYRLAHLFGTGKTTVHIQYVHAEARCQRSQMRNRHC